MSLSSLRVRLLLLVLLAIVPAMGLILYTAAEQRRADIAESRGKALRLARQASHGLQDHIKDAEHILIALAQLPQVHRRDTRACNKLVADILKGDSHYGNLGAVDESGNVFCSALPLRKKVNVSDRAYFRRAIENEGFAVSEYEIGRISGRRNIFVSYPVRKKNGSVHGVVLAAVDLEWMNRLGTAEVLPEGSTFAVIDRNGTVLVHYPEPQKWIGFPLPNVWGIAIDRTKQEGVAEVVGEDKVQRLLGFSQVSDPSYGSQGIYAVVTVPTKTVLADVNRVLVRNLIALGVVAVLALIAAWFGGDLFVLRKVKKLVVATRRFASGDLRVRAGSFYSGELGQIARAFDEMAEALATRQAQVERAGVALQESNEKFRALIEASPLPIIALDLKGNVTMWNQAAERVFGWREQEVLGLPIPIIPTEMNVEFQETFQAALQGKIVSNMETRRQKRDGSLIDVSIFSASVHDSKGTVVSGIALFTDITERKQTEQQLEDQRRALHQNEKLASIGQLAAGVAHELNNPISFVKSNMGTLLEYVGEISGILQECQGAMVCWESGEREKCCLFIKQALHLAKQSDLENLIPDLRKIVDESLEGAERVAQIVQDLKNFARADEAELKYADINQGIESTLNIVWNELKYKATVIKELGELPEIECYPMQLNQVFMNLLVNAAQAIPEKGEIRIKTFVRDEEVVVEISDTGVGITPEHLTHLFKPFFTTKPVGKGTGLGLSIAYGIVKDHGGSIEVESEPGKGSLFRVRFPMEGKYAAAHDSVRG